MKKSFVYSILAVSALIFMNANKAQADDGQGVWESTKQVAGDTWDGAKEVTGDIKEGVSGNAGSQNTSESGENAQKKSSRCADKK